MKRSLGITLVLVFALTLAPLALHAQDVASVTGVVTDTTGAIIVGADIALVNTGTNASYHAATNSVGSYTIVNVLPGPGYKMTITKSGFEPLTVKDISLNVATTRTQNVKLNAGNVSTTLEVSAASAEVTIDTTDATIGNNLDVKLLNDLPVQVRNSPQTLFSLQPGVVSGSVTGARTDQSDVTVDGLDVNDITTGQTFLVVSNAPVDSIEEFRGTVAGQLSTSGPGGGGQFQLVTKSGTNSFHGDLNEYHRDTNLVANSWFNNNTHVKRPALIRNQFGGQVGGPVLKDKLFFFFNFYDSRTIQSASVEATVPMTSYSGGSINYILANASNGSGACGAASRVSTTPQCIGQMTPAQIKSLDPLGIGFSPTVQSFLSSRYPAPNDLTFADGVNSAGYRFTTPTPTLETNYVARVDYQLNKTMKFFARATIEREDATQTPVRLPGDPISNPFFDRSYSYVAGHTWTIGPNKVNSFYYGDTIEKFNFATTYAPLGTTTLTFGGYASAPFLGSPYNSPQVQKRRIPIPVVRDDFNWLKGSHSVGFGGTFKFIKTESQQINDFNFVSMGLGGNMNSLTASLRPSAANGMAPIRGGVTAPNDYDNAFSFALGHISDISTNYNYTAAGTALPAGTGHIRRYRYYQTELYAADTWKVTKELTLSYGLHYQLYTVPYEVSGAESIGNMGFDQYYAARVAQSTSGASGNSSLPFYVFNLGGKANNAGPIYQPSYKDFSPRFSFAYNPSFHPKLVINGGAGIVYDRTVINALNFLQDQTSYLFQNSANHNYGIGGDPVTSLKNDPRVTANFGYSNPNVAPTITKPFTPYVSGGVPLGLAQQQVNLGIDPNLKDPYSIAFNAGVQEQLPWHMVLKVNYVGRLGRRLLGFADGSQLLDFPDKASGQMMSTAFAAITTAARSGADTTHLPAQPWFEHVAAAALADALSAPASVGGPFPNVTSYFATDFFEPPLGDFADFIQELAANGYIPANVGMASQISINSVATNKGFSSYNGLLTTLSKNLSHGLQFDFNYTYSHSIDNASLIANSVPSGTGIGFICEIQNPRACRGNSDFDETHVMNGDFTYQLPFGKGKTFAGNSSRWVDEVIGGWSVSGIPSWHSGIADTTTSSAFVAGFANDAPSIFNGKRSVIHAHVHKTTSGAVNLYDDPVAANAAFTGPVGFQIGSRNILRGAPAYALDAGLGKVFPIVADRVNMKFRADAFNVLNHPTFGLPFNDTSQQSGTPFGQISSTTTTARVLQVALRLEF